MSQGRWEPTLGIEVHVQLATRSKLFCRCPAVFGAEPNTAVCPVCLGHPGVLPVLNRRAVELGAQAALLLDMEVQLSSKFDRKNYFYPDLPKGYQISQYDQPLARDGRIVLRSGREVRIARLHLEEDAGKAIHDRGDFGLVDFNRAGVPLAEIVSAPDLQSPAEALEYLETLRERLRWAGVSDCDLEKGNLRADLNVSVAEPGRRASGVRTELKNLNSFAAAAKALEFEIARQISARAGGEELRQETRAWDEARGVTRTLRIKEEADDYRYFPDPDLPRLELGADWLEAQRAALPEPRERRRARYRQQLGLSEYDAGLMTGEREISDYFEEVVAAGVEPKAAANWIANELLRRAAGQGLQAAGVSAADLAAALGLLAAGRINASGARALLDAWQGGAQERAEALVARLGLVRQDDAAEMGELCRQAVAALPAAAADFRAGKEKALSALLGHVMRATRGGADPALARRLLLELLGR